MKKLLLVALLFFTACNSPNRDMKIESLKNGTYRTTGAFKNEFSLPTAIPAKTILYVQNGHVFQSLSLIDPRQAQCTLEVNHFQVSYPEMLAAYHVSKLPLARASSFFKQSGLAHVELIKMQDHISIRISDYVPSPILTQKAPFTRIRLKLDANLNCGRTSSGLQQTTELTLGELMRIFQFKFIWNAPSV